MPNKHDYLYNWMEDENYKLLMESISVVDGIDSEKLESVQKTLKSALDNNDEQGISESLNEFSTILLGISDNLENKGLMGLKAFIDHTKFIVETAVENEKEKAPTQMEKGKEWLFANYFPAPIKEIEPLNREMYSPNELDKCINDLGFAAIWSALQDRIDAEKRLNEGVKDAEEAEILRDEIITANNNFIAANNALSENLSKEANEPYVKMFEGKIERNNIVPKMLEEQNKTLENGVFVGLLDEYEFINKAKKDVAEISRKASILARELDEVKGSAHKRSKYFNAMEDALAKVTALSPNDSSYDEVVKALINLEKATKAYTDNRNRFQHNSARITKAENLNSFASEKMKAFTRNYKGTELSIVRGCNKSLDEHIADVMVSGQEKLVQEQTERRKLRLIDFKRIANRIVGNNEITAAYNFLNYADRREGSESYKEFKESISALAQIDTENWKNSAEEIMDMIDDVIKSTDTYIKEHKGLHIGDGKRRIEYAQTVNKFLKTNYNVLNTAYQQLGNDRGAYSIRDIARTLEEGPAPKKKLKEISLEKLDFINPAYTEKMRETGEDVYTKRYRTSSEMASVGGVMYSLIDEMEREMSVGKYPGERKKEMEVRDIISGIARITLPYNSYVKGDKPTEYDKEEWEKTKNKAVEFKKFIEDKSNFSLMIELAKRNTIKRKVLNPENLLWSIHKLNDVFGVGINISELERDYYKDQLEKGEVDEANIRKVRGKAALLDTKYKQRLQAEEKEAEKEELAEKMKADKKAEEKPAVEEKKESVKNENKSFDVGENLKAAQKQLENIKTENGGVVPDASAMAGPMAEIITSLMIMTISNKETSKNITREQFDIAKNGHTLNNPSFDTLLKNTAPADLFEQATKEKGQNLFANFQQIEEKRKELNDESKKVPHISTEIKKGNTKTY